MRQYYGSSKAQRNQNLEKVLEQGGICLTTYGMLLSNIDALCTTNDTENIEENTANIWDYLILDEGHKIKV